MVGVDGPGSRHVEVHEAVLGWNERQAERNRGFFRAKGWLILNVLSAPGAGKTTLIQQSIGRLGDRAKVAVVVGDLATDHDARRLRQAAVSVVQITTGTICHLDADMVARAVGKLSLEEGGVLVIENVGNLVCPAAFDLGEDLRVAVLSVTEGEDKPLKYPPLFTGVDAVVISKVDMSVAAGFDRVKCYEALRRVAPRARVFEVSAKTGEGMDVWCEYLLERRRAHGVSL